MFEKSEMLKCLEDKDGFTINEPENAPSELSSALLIALFDILLKYGMTSLQGYRSVIFVNPIFHMTYYFGGDSVQPNPSFHIDIHHPRLFNLSTHYRFFLDNGIYVSWNGNGASIKDVWEIVRRLDSSAVRKKMKNDSLISSTRYPITVYYDEKTQGSSWDYIKKHSKLYMKLIDIDLKDCSIADFGDKAKFFSKVPDNLEGFAPANPEKAPPGITPEILKDVWESVCRLGEFHTDDRKERARLSLAQKNFCVNAYNGSLDWAINLHIMNLKRVEPNSSNKHFDFKLKNGLKVWWDTSFSVLDARTFLNKFKRDSILVCENEQGDKWTLPFPFCGAIPVLIDSNFSKRTETLAFSEYCKTKRT